MRTIKIKVDLDCSRCHRKIERVLDRIREKGEFVIDDIEYDEKNNIVIVKGPFDADRLADKLCCKACKIIKEIEIVELPPPPPPEPEPEPPKKEEPAPPPPEPVVEEPPPPAVVEPEPPVCEPEPEPPKKEEPAPPPPPPTKVVEVPYPWPYPYPYPAWPSDCCCHHGHGGCHCCSCKEEPAPAPPPPQYNIYPQYPQPAYPCGGYKIVCEEDPNYACSIM
ncbi:hypothetical protein ACQ4PT_001577 [Festuca glaucescens]